MQTWYKGCKQVFGNAKFLGDLTIITEEITAILKNFITPMTEENAQLKLEFEAASKRIDNLNSQLLDI